MNPFVPQKLPIQHVDWEPLIPWIGKANRALAHYDGILNGIHNPDVLISPLTTQEAVLSSRIEGTHATLGEVLRHEAGDLATEESTKEDIYEIINYRNALRYAEMELQNKPFDLNLLLRLHEILLDSVRGTNKGRGQFRRVQNWIGTPGSTQDTADYVPPEPLLVMENLDNWEKYYHLDRPDPLVQLAVVHAQFEIIHPFVDGNGRLGRMLVPLFLYEKRILSHPSFYLSEYLETNRDIYYAKLRALQQPENWNQWVEFFLIALIEQAHTNSIKVNKMMQLYENLKKRVLELTHSQYAIPLLDFIFSKPLFSTSDLLNIERMPSRQTVLSILVKLKDARILSTIVEGTGRRAQVLALTELINLCEGREVV